MIKTKFKPIYKKPGETHEWVRKLQGKKGVYLIKKKSERKASYIGHSESNLYKTILRHFQSWNDPTQTRVTYPKTGYLLRVVLTDRKGQAERLERALIIKRKPKDNPNKLELFTATKSEEKIYDDFMEIREVPF